MPEAEAEAAEASPSPSGASKEDGVSGRGKKAPRRMQPQKRTLLSAFFFPREDVGCSPDRSIPREQGEGGGKEKGEGALPIGRTEEPGDSKWGQRERKEKEKHTPQIRAVREQVPQETTGSFLLDRP